MYSVEYILQIKDKAFSLSYRTSIPQAHAFVFREAAEAIEQLLAVYEAKKEEVDDGGMNSHIRLAG